MNDKIDLIIIGKFETVDYKGYSQLPIDRIDMYKDLVQLRTVYMDGGCHHFLDINLDNSSSLFSSVIL